MRRTRLVDPRKLRLWPDWRHFAFLTDLAGDAVEVDAFHRRHATVGLAIRDLKEGSGLDHVPSGKFAANSACLQCAVLAHDLIRWTATIARTEPVDQLTIARSVRRRLSAVPARLVNHAGTLILRCPLRWPWRHWFMRRLGRAAHTPAGPRLSALQRAAHRRRSPGADNPTSRHARVSRSRIDLHANGDDAATLALAATSARSRSLHAG